MNARAVECVNFCNGIDIPASKSPSMTLKMLLENAIEDAGNYLTQKQIDCIFYPFYPLLGLPEKECEND